MARVAGVSDSPPCFPHTPPGVNVLEGRNMYLGCGKSIKKIYCIFIYNCCTGLTIDSCWSYGLKESLHHYLAVVQL